VTTVHASHHHYADPSYEGTVVLDIGGYIGALVIVTGPGDIGREIEVSRVGEDTRTHVAVRERRIAGNTMYCAVYPRLAAGRYTIWRDDVTPIADVHINGAEIAQFTWPRPIAA
jgi:hypothetical protein